MRMTHRVVATIAACAVGSAVAGSNTGVTSPAPVDSARTAPGESPIYGLSLPLGYRQWEMVSVSYEAPFDEFRGIVGNRLALDAYRAGVLPFPDGAVLVKLAWKRVPSPEFEGAFLPGAATTVQVMVKDARRFATSGGWGFGRFTQGVPADEAQHLTCFACHAAKVKDHDFVFTRLAP